MGAWGVRGRSSALVGVGSGVAPKTWSLTTRMYIKSFSCMYSIVSFKNNSLSSVIYNFLVI